MCFMGLQLIGGTHGSERDPSVAMPAPDMALRGLASRANEARVPHLFAGSK